MSQIFLVIQSLHSFEKVLSFSFDACNNLSVAICQLPSRLPITCHNYNIFMALISLWRQLHAFIWKIFKNKSKKKPSQNFSFTMAHLGHISWTARDAADVSRDGASGNCYNVLPFNFKQLALWWVKFIRLNTFCS